MKNAMHLESLLAYAIPELARAPTRSLFIFASLNLGIIELLADGLLSATDAVRLFYNADNCLFVRRKLPGKLADKIMSHGVQLPDLFDALPADEAHRQFQRELATMRALCSKLLKDKQLVA
jgi:hypothetical protein